MGQRLFFGLTIAVIFLISVFATPYVRRGDELDYLLSQRNRMSQNYLDRQALADYRQGELFVFAKDIRVGYLDWETDEFIDIQRQGAYIFENEMIIADVFVRSPAGLRDILDVYVTIGSTIGSGNDPEHTCTENLNKKEDLNRKIQFNPETDIWFKCEFTAETPNSMYSQYWITAEVSTMSSGKKIAENMNLFYFFNPFISISVKGGDVKFEGTRPEEKSLSNEIIVINEGDYGYNVPLEIFISGTNLYDSNAFKARCPTSNQLSLKQIKYKSRYKGQESEFTKIDYSTRPDLSIIEPILEGYPINEREEVGLTFQIEFPERCNGNFDDGFLYIWAKPKDNSPYTPVVGVRIGMGS